MRLVRGLQSQSCRPRSIQARLHKDSASGLRAMHDASGRADGVAEIPLRRKIIVDLRSARGVGCRADAYSRSKLRGAFACIHTSHHSLRRSCSQLSVYLNAHSTERHRRKLEPL